MSTRINKLNDGFVSASSNNLPVVDFEMFMDFIEKSINSRLETQGWKMVKTCRANYGDNAIGYVQVKRINNVVHVIAKITPEHKLRNTPYSVEARVDEKNECIQLVKCYDCVARQGQLRITVGSLRHDEVSALEAKESFSSIIEFPIQTSDNFTRFTHLLYVYPVNLSLSSLTGKFRARNILCRVFLRCEDDLEASPLDQNPVCGSISTYVLHHKSNPEWGSEIKLSLPQKPDGRLHLLFQFFHISCSFDKGGKQVENVVGYSWVPLVNKFRFIGGDREHVLPVAGTLPSGYLSIQNLGLGKGSHFEDDSLGGSTPQLLQIARSRKHQRHSMQQYAGPDITWLDKCTLTVKLNLVSTVWTKCGSLGAFFTQSEKIVKGAGKFHCDDETTAKTIRSLESIDLQTLRDFFPTIINEICAVSTISKTVSSSAFKFLIFSFHSLVDSNFEHIIEQYIQYRYLSGYNEQVSNNNKKLSEPTMAEVLIDAWIDLFETGDGGRIALSLEHSRHLFSMIVKSMAVQGYQCSTNNLDESKLVKMTQLFTSELVQRCQLDHDLAQRANNNFTTFISSLLSVLTQRHVVFAAINSFLMCFGPGDNYKLQNFRFTFLQSLVEHPLFLELNCADGDEEGTRLDSIPWTKRHFLVASVMKQSRAGLGEVVNVRSLALKPILAGLSLHERDGCKHFMYLPWLRVVCDNLHRVSSASLNTASSRCSSVSNVLASTSSTLVHAAMWRNLGKEHEGHNHGMNNHHSHLGIISDSNRSSCLSLNIPPNNGQNGSTINLNNLNASGANSVHGGNGNNNAPGTNGSTSVDRLSLGGISNCDYLDAISAIKLSNPTASMAMSTSGSDTETIVNESTINNGSGDGQSIAKEPSDEGEGEDSSVKISRIATTEGGDKSGVILRRYDKLNDVETSQLLLSGVYLLKCMGSDTLSTYWNKSSSQEKSSLLQMIQMAVFHMCTVRKNFTITWKKVGIVVPTTPSSPRSSLALPNKKWSSLPSKTTDDDSTDKGSSAVTAFEGVSDWKALSTETTFVCLDTLSNLVNACKGESNEMRDIIRTTLDVAKASDDTRALLGALSNLYKIDDLPAIVFAKGNDDLSHQLFCDLLNGFGTSYLINICVLLLAKLFMYNAERTTTSTLLAISSLSLHPVFVHNFRKALQLLETNMSLSDRSSFVLSITEKLAFIDVSEFQTSPKKDGRSPSPQPSARLVCPANSSSGKINSKLADLPARLSTILNSLWLLRSSQNEYRIPELYWLLANSYCHFARSRLRIDALDSLKEWNISRKRYSEALACELHVAARLARTAAPEVKKILLGISRNLSCEFEELESQSDDEEETTEELIQRLENCVHLCQNSERYEIMLELYRILVDIQESLSDYASLQHSYQQMSRVCGIIQNKRERFLATYYRVALFHPKKKLGKREIDIYVYKEPNVTTLTEICSNIETAESASIISGEVDLPDDDVLYATITHVNPIPSESPRRKLWSEDFRRHQNVNQFSYDTPFTMKAQDKITIDNTAVVERQWKKRTTITTEFTFPSVVPRIKVIGSEEQNLSPIVVCIDDMSKRCLELRSEFNSMDIKRIQLRLQGSVSVSVNKGPLEYARAFLEKESSYPVEEINKLKAIFRDFVECCGELLVRNGQLIPPEQADYQTQLETDYNRLYQTLAPLLGLPDQALNNRMSRISISSY